MFCTHLTTSQPVSPRIFETKWLKKFTSLAENQLPRTKPELEWGQDIPYQLLFVQKARLVVQHMPYCSREARMLGLELPEPGTVLANPRVVATAVCAMLAHRADIDEFVEAWKKLKNGKRLNGAYRWQEYPLQLRRDLILCWRR